MEPAQIEELQRLSHRLFRNATMLPVAWALLDFHVGAAVTAREVRERLGGRFESNQIREVLERLAEIGAVKELPYPGKPHPRTWERSASPAWEFFVAWSAQQTTVALNPKSKQRAGRVND